MGSIEIASRRSACSPPPPLLLLSLRASSVESVQPCRSVPWGLIWQTSRPTGTSGALRQKRPSSRHGTRRSLATTTISTHSSGMMRVECATQTVATRASPAVTSPKPPRPVMDHHAGGEGYDGGAQGRPEILLHGQAWKLGSHVAGQARRATLSAEVWP